MSETNERARAEKRDASARGDGGAADDRQASRRETGGQARQHDRGPGNRFALTVTQWLLAIVGLLVVLFGVGQAFGVPLLAWVGEALSSQMGQWLAVAFVGLLIIYAAANLDRS